MYDEINDYEDAWEVLRNLLRLAKMISNTADIKKMLEKMEEIELKISNN